MHDLIIIGAGPAGLTAALYAGRYRLNTLLLEKMAAGGQIILSSSIENFPGFPGGISTEELIERLKKQTEELGINIEMQEALSISKGVNAGFSIKAGDKSFQTKSIIISTGAKPKPLGAKGEDTFVGRGVSYCATCDGPLFRNKEVVVVGGGDRAVEEAIFLSSYAKSVYLVHRREELRASQILIEKLKTIPQVNFVLESIIEEIQGKDRVEKIRLKNVLTNAQKEISCQGVFIFVGISPNTGFLGNLLETSEEGFIMTDEEMQTSLAGIFACGDCRKKSLYQVITACGEGAVAAHSAHKYLLNQNI